MTDFYSLTETEVIMQNRTWWKSIAHRKWPSQTFNLFLLSLLHFRFDLFPSSSSLPFTWCLPVLLTRVLQASISYLPQGEAEEGPFTLPFKEKHQHLGLCFCTGMEEGHTRQSHRQTWRFWADRLKEQGEIEDFFI